jgi:hypothetical protein
VSALQPGVFDSLNKLSSSPSKFFAADGTVLSDVRNESLMMRLADSDVLKVVCDRGETCVAHIDDLVAKVVTKDPSSAMKVPAIVKGRLPEKSSKFVMTAIVLSKLPSAVPQVADSLATLLDYVSKYNDMQQADEDVLSKMDGQALQRKQDFATVVVNSLDKQLTQVTGWVTDVLERAAEFKPIVVSAQKWTLQEDGLEWMVSADPVKTQEMETKVQSAITGLKELRRGKQTIDKIVSLCTYGMQPKGEELKAQLAKVPQAKLTEVAVSIATLCVADVLCNPANPKNANMKAAIDGCLQFASRDLGVQKKDLSKELMEKADAAIALFVSKTTSAPASSASSGPAPSGAKRAAPSDNPDAKDKKDKKEKDNSKAGKSEKKSKKG